MPMRTPHPNTGRVPEINPLIDQIRREAIVPQIGRQLADKWESLSTALQTPTMPGSVSTPQMTLNIPAVLDRLDQGKLTLTLPLLPGSIKLGPLRQVVKPNTFFQVEMEVKDGYVQTDKTSLSVWRSGNSESACCPSWKPDPHPSKLSGPAAPVPGLRKVAGLKGISFGRQGNLQANLVGLNYNLDKLLELPSERPLKVGEFVGKLLEKAELQPDLEIASAQSYAMSNEVGAGRKRINSVESPDTQTPQEVGRNKLEQDSDDDTAALTESGNPDEVAPDDWLDWGNMHYNFTGDFKPGDLSVGDDSVLRLKKGTKVTVFDADPRTLAVNLDAALDSAELQAQGTRWSCGEGRANFNLTLESPEPLGSPDCVSLRFSDFDLQNVLLQVPANIEDELGQSLNHHLHLNTLSLKDGGKTSSQGAKQSFGVVYDNRISRTGQQLENDSGEESDQSASLRINLPQLHLGQATAVLHTLGAGTGSGRLQMGMGDGAWQKAPMTILSGLSMESTPTKHHFEIEGQVASGRLDLVANGQGRLARMGLVASDSLSVAARAIRLQGTGGFGFRQEGDSTPHLYLSSEAQDAPWQVVIEDYDASLSDAAQGLKVDVYDQGSTRSLGEMSANKSQSTLASSMPDRRAVGGISGRTLPRSQLAVRALAFGGALSNIPSFDAEGVLAVTLGRLQYRGAENEHNLNLQGGSHGELIIQKALWPAEAPSPEVAAQLRLTAGGDVKFAVSEIKTLEGADIDLRVGDKGANLELDFKTDTEGRLNCDTNITLNEGRVRTSVLQITPEDFENLQNTLTDDARHSVRLSQPQQPYPESLPFRAGFRLDEQPPLEPMPLAQVAPSLRLENVDDLILSLVPRLKLNTEFLPILKAVKTAEVTAELPLAALKKSLPETIKFAQNASAKLRFSVKDGKVDEGKIEFQPSLDISWGVFTFKLKEIQLVGAEEDGALVVQPSAGVRFLGVPTYVPAGVQNWATGKLLHSLLGRSDLPDQLSPLVSVLANSSEQINDQLSAHVVIEPKINERQRAKVDIRAGLGRYHEGDEQSAVSQLSEVEVSQVEEDPRVVVSTEQGRDSSVSGAAVTIKADKVEPFELDLGDGQKLACGDKSNLSLTLQDELLQVSGHLDLSGDQGATSITTSGYAFSFEEGAVDIDAVFSVGKSQPSRCELKNAHLKGLRFSAQPMGLSQTLEVPEIKQGSLVLSYQDGKPTVTCAVDTERGGAPFTLKWDGVSAVGDQQFGAKDLTIQGGLNEVMFDSEGVKIVAPQVKIAADELMLPLGEGQHVMASMPLVTAKAVINLDVKGDAMQLDLLDCNTAVEADKNLLVTLYEQGLPRDTFRFGPLSADKITLAVGSGVTEPGLKGQGLRCDDVALEKSLDIYQDNPEEETALGLGKIRFEKGQVELADFYVGDEDYRFTGQVDSGRINVHDFTLAGGGLALQAPHLVCEGDMQFDIQSNVFALKPKSSSDELLSIRSQLSDVSLVTRSPEMNLQLKGDRILPSGRTIGPTLDAKLVGLNIVQGDVATGYAHFADAVLRGRLEQGDIVVGPEDSALNRVQLHSGEADVEIDTLRLDLPEDGVSDPELLLRAKLRMNSEVRDVRLPGAQTNDEVEQVSDDSEPLPIQMFVERMSLQGKLNLTMDALLQTGADFNAWIESAARVDEGQANFAIHGQLDDLRKRGVANASSS